MSLRRDGGPDSCSGAPGGLGALLIYQSGGISGVSAPVSMSWVRPRLQGKWLDRVNIEVTATRRVHMRAETNS